MKFKNLKELMVKFSDETVCREYMEQLFWNGKPQCPYCQYDEKIYRIEGGKRYKCKQCQKKFSITVGTIFESSNVPMSTWFAAIYLITSHKKGISSLQLGRDLGVTQKTAWFILHRLRELFKDKSPDRLEGTTEIDESFIGGKEKNKHKSKRQETTGRVNIKIPVLGIMQREGRVFAQKMDSVTIEEMYPIIKSKVAEGANIMTDDLPAYNKLGLNFNHYVINHSEGVYARGLVHTNTIEGFWSLLKRGIVGIYHFVSYKHLNAYCNEFGFRYNTRELSENLRFDVAVVNASGRRLKYKNLISKFRTNG